MNERFEKKYSIICSVLFTLLWALSLITTILLFLNPNFSFNLTPGVGLGDSEFALSNYIEQSFIITSLNFSNMSLIPGPKNILFISLHSITMFYISLALIAVIFFKKKFLSSNNKFRRAIQYLIISIFTLALGILAYYIGRYSGSEYIWHDAETYTRIYYYKRSMVPIFYGIILIILDIPYLILGIKEYRLMNTYNKNLSFKEKIISYFSDRQNAILTVMIIYTLFMFIGKYIINDGIKFTDAIKVFLN